MSQALRKLAGTLNRTDTICLFTNQLREKIGVMFGSPETTPGGRALKFYASVRLDIRRIETLKDGAEAYRQPRPGQGGQEQGRAAVQAGRVRHHLRLRASPGRARSSTSGSSGRSSRSRARTSASATSGSARAARTRRRSCASTRTSCSRSSRRSRREARPGADRLGAPAAERGGAEQVTPVVDESRMSERGRERGGGRGSRLRGLARRATDGVTAGRRRDGAARAARPRPLGGGARRRGSGSAASARPSGSRRSRRSSGSATWTTSASPATRAEQLAERGSGDALIRDDLERRGVAAELVERALDALEPERERAARIAARARRRAARPRATWPRAGSARTRSRPIVARGGLRSDRIGSASIRRFTCIARAFPKSRSEIARLVTDFRPIVAPGDQEEPPASSLI